MALKIAGDNRAVRTHDMPALFILIEYGAPHIVDELPEYRPNRLAVMAETWKQCHAFDAQSEYRQDIHNVPSFGWLAKLIAHTVYNPSDGSMLAKSEKLLKHDSFTRFVASPHVRLGHK